jgi:inner membrane protein
MDSLTQIVLGGAIGELVAGRKMGNRAVLWGAIAGTIPDLDVFFRVFYHPIEAALVHRGFSHSLLFSLLVSPILAYLLNIATKRTYGFRLWTKLFFWGIVTHPILDMFTNYGTQFLWPFESRITFNSVFVIDPLYTVPFMVLLIWAMRLDRNSAKRRRLNRIGLIYSTAYLFLGLLIKWFVWTESKAYVKAHHLKVNRMMVTPMPFTCFYWYVLGENNNQYVVMHRSIFNDQITDKPGVIDRGPWRIKHLSWAETNHNRDLHRFTSDFCLIQEKGNTLRAYDLRFGYTGKFTREKINTPIMGYEFERNKSRIVDTKMYRTKAWNLVDFGYYTQCVFGRTIAPQNP